MCEIILIPKLSKLALIQTYISRESLNTLMLMKVHLEFIIWIYDTFDNKFEIKNDITKHLKGSFSL